MLTRDSNPSSEFSPATRPDPTWHEMTEMFRALGGVADNVILQRGPLGRGLFALDPAKSFLLRVPPNLLLAVDDVQLVGERIRIKKRVKIGELERRYFEDYEDLFSWGGGGRSESVEFIAALESLPSDVRALLSTEFYMGDFLEGDRTQTTWKWFLNSRSIQRNGKKLLMPLIELANRAPHGFSCGVDPRGWLQVEGNARDEILINYGVCDAFGLFHGHGIASPQPHAFSLPMKTKMGATKLTIDREICARARRAAFEIPRMKLVGHNLFLTYLMIGHSKFPRLSRGIFQTLIREARGRNADEAFNAILHFNRTKFLRLLVALEPYEGEMVVTLRRMARYQLEAMTHCIGTREL